MGAFVAPILFFEIIRSHIRNVADFHSVFCMKTGLKADYPLAYPLSSGFP